MARAIENDYTFEAGGQRFGFWDASHSTLGYPTRWYTEAHLGPLGAFSVPFSAGTGWAIVIGVPILLAMIAAGVRMRRRRLTSTRHT